MSPLFCCSESTLSFIDVALHVPSTRLLFSLTTLVIGCRGGGGVGSNGAYHECGDGLEESTIGDGHGAEERIERFL